MKTETSAGGIIVRKYRSGWQVLLIQDRSNAWTFPKGKLEHSETRQQAAVREILEEVGLDGLVRLSALPVLKYRYKRNGLVDKRVYYFLFRYDGHGKPVCQTEEGIKSAKWVSLSASMSLIGYPESNMPLLERVIHLPTTI